MLADRAARTVPIFVVCLAALSTALWLRGGGGMRISLSVPPDVARDCGEVGPHGDDPSSRDALTCMADAIAAHQRFELRIDEDPGCLVGSMLTAVGRTDPDGYRIYTTREWYSDILDDPSLPAPVTHRCSDVHLSIDPGKRHGWASLTCTP